jgi:hypothetical protein
MIHINKFIEKVSLNEQKKSKDIVIPISEARGLRDEVVRLLTDLYEKKSTKQDEVVRVEITGGKFK